MDYRRVEELNKEATEAEDNDEAEHMDYINIKIQ
jgi:hypothetical protein